MAAQLLMEPMHQVSIQHARRESTHQVPVISPSVTVAGLQRIQNKLQDSINGLVGIARQSY